MAKGKDVITGLKGPVEIDGPKATVEGDVITGNDGPVEVAAPTAAGTFSGEGDRDWTDVNNRVIALSGVNINNYGDIHYTEEAAEISDDDVEDIDAAFVEAGAEQGAGARVANAIKSLGYGFIFDPKEA